MAFLELSLAVSSESLAVALPLTDLWLFSTSRSCRKKLMVDLSQGNGSLRLRAQDGEFYGARVRSSVLGNHLKLPVLRPQRLTAEGSRDSGLRAFAGAPGQWRVEALQSSSSVVSFIGAGAQ